MGSVQSIRQRLRGERIEALRHRIEPLLGRGDWDARSDVAWHLP